MKNGWWSLLVVLGLIGGLALVGLACATGGDKNNDGTEGDDAGGPPSIPHGFDNTTNCLASNCHAGVHYGSYDSAQIPAACLNCHSAAQ